MFFCVICQLKLNLGRQSSGSQIFLESDLAERQLNSGLRYGFQCWTDVDGNISYLTIFQSDL